MCIQICVYGDVRKKIRLIWERRHFQYTTTFPMNFFGAAVVQLMNNDREFGESFKITFLSFVLSSWKFQSRECSPPVARQCRPDLHRSQCIASRTCQTPCVVILRWSFSCLELGLYSYCKRAVQQHHVDTHGELVDSSS